MTDSILHEAQACRQLAEELVRVAERIEARFPTCPVCWVRFEPRATGQLYCSAKCRREAKRQRYEVNRARGGDEDCTTPRTPADIQRDLG